MIYFDTDYMAGATSTAMIHTSTWLLLACCIYLSRLNTAPYIP